MVLTIALSPMPWLRITSRKQAAPVPACLHVQLLSCRTAVLLFGCAWAVHTGRPTARHS